MNGPWIEQPSKGNFSYQKLHIFSFLLLILFTIHFLSEYQCGPLVIDGVLSLDMLERQFVKVKTNTMEFISILYSFVEKVNEVCNRVNLLLIHRKC